jgi:hypothetical protein
VVEGGREAADVPSVAHRDQRQHRDLSVLGRVQRALEHVEGEVVAQERVGQLVPQGLRHELLLG